MKPANRREMYAVQGIFRIDTRSGGIRAGAQTVFERRVIHIAARSEQEAKGMAHKRFARDTWVAAWPVEDVAQPPGRAPAPREGSSSRVDDTPNPSARHGRHVEHRPTRPFSSHTSWENGVPGLLPGWHARCSRQGVSEAGGRRAVRGGLLPVSEIPRL